MTEKTGTVYIGLGSNWETAVAELGQSMASISRLPGCKVLRASSIYLTEPQDFREQPWFHNQACAVELEPQWTPQAFLQELLRIEARQGRTRSWDQSLRFGPRKIDLDLLIFRNETSDNPDCLLPHPRLAGRAFALVPLQEIAPGLLLYGEPLSAWLERLDWEMKDNVIWQKN